MARQMILFALSAAIAATSPASAQSRSTGPEKASAPAISCDAFLPARKQVGGKIIGPDECKIVSEEVVFNLKGQGFRRFELRISGTLDGYAVKQGPRTVYFNDAPDFVFAQSGNNGPRFHGTGRYSGATGHGMTLFVPLEAANWNGKLYVTAHGAGAYGPVNTLILRDREADFNPLTNHNRYVGLMLDRGYAVAHTLRSTQIGGGDVAVTLDDGTSAKANISSHAGFIQDMTRIAETVVQRQLGRTSAHTYFYGFSAGGFLGRMVHYAPGLNTRDDGRPLFDAFLIDDAGGGEWRPVLIVDGKDTLFVGEDKARFKPQIDITHQLYAGDSNDFLIKKRQNAEILRAKGLGDKHRLYEVRGVSHFDAGQTQLADLVPQTLDLGGLMASFIDMLDRWVEKGEAPPPSRSDVATLTGADNPAIALPEVACPLGIRYVFPAAHGTSRRAYQETAFAAFDGANLEPIDGRGQFVDMNGNGKRDTRESLAQAWIRLGLLKTGERLTRGKYMACVASTAAKLVDQGFLPPRMLPYYVNRSAVSGIGEVDN
jgi:alpha/beta hydrolase family protein